VSSLNFIQTGNGGTNFIGTSAAITLNGCNTAYTVPNDAYNAQGHYFPSSEFSIAQLLADSINRGGYGIKLECTLAQRMLISGGLILLLRTAKGISFL
jgi:hypothetical protein